MKNRKCSVVLYHSQWDTRLNFFFLICSRFLFYNNVFEIVYRIKIAFFFFFFLHFLVLIWAHKKDCENILWPSSNPLTKFYYIRSVLKINSRWTTSYSFLIFKLKGEIPKKILKWCKLIVCVELILVDCLCWVDISWLLVLSWY